MKSNFVADVIETNWLLPYVISVHLHIERWLRELLSLSKSNRGILSRSDLYFLDLVNLCQTQKVLDEDLILILRRLNSLRNKFAHTRSFSSRDQWIDNFLRLFRELKKPFYIPLVEATEKELAIALASLSGHLERILNEKKAHPAIA